MSMALDRLCFVDLLVMPTAVELSVWMGVLGCGCPNSSSVMREGVASLALWKIAASSASAADDMTWRRIFARARTGPLRRVLVVSPRKW